MIKLEEMTLGQLKLEVASKYGAHYLMMMDYEKEDRKLPVTKEQMIKYLSSFGVANGTA